MSFFPCFFRSRRPLAAALVALVLFCGALIPGTTEAASAAGQGSSAQAGAEALAKLSPDTGILLAVFGTSEPQALAAYQRIAEDYEKIGVPVVWAYTSNIIRAKMAKAGTKLASLNEALDELAGKGVKKIRVQSLHMAAGEEFSQMERGVYAYVLRHPGVFSSVLMGRPLLESAQDMHEVVAAVLDEFPRERKPTEAIVLMGHGHAGGRADLPALAAHDAFKRRDALVFLATVEGALTFDQVLADLKARGIKHVWLAPFMVVAGDHARNDLAGSDAESWASRLKAEGMSVSSHLKGLGELPGVRKVFVRHSLETKDDLLRVKGVE